MARRGTVGNRQPKGVTGDRNTRIPCRSSFLTTNNTQFAVERLSRSESTIGFVPTRCARMTTSGKPSSDVTVGADPTPLSSTPIRVLEVSDDSLCVQPTSSAENTRVKKPVIPALRIPAQVITTRFRARFMIITSIQAVRCWSGDAAQSSPACAGFTQPP